MNSNQECVRRREVWRGEGTVAKLTYYPPMSCLPRHAHETDQYSMLLLGGFHEQSQRSEIEICSFSTGYKSAGLEHGNVFGKNGALIFSVDTKSVSSADTLWKWGAANLESGTASLVGQLIDKSTDHSQKTDLTTEFIATVSNSSSELSTSLKNPPWLHRVRERIEEEPHNVTLETLANDAGVHHVHLSRHFSKVVGVPVSVYRRRVMSIQALNSIIENNTPLAAAAVETGFADQSHFTRVMRSATGLTPHRLASIFI